MPVKISRGSCKVCCNIGSGQDIQSNQVLYEDVCGLCLFRKLHEAEREIARLQATYEGKQEWSFYGNNPPPTHTDPEPIIELDKHVDLHAKPPTKGINEDQ